MSNVDKEALDKLAEVTEWLDSAIPLIEDPDEEEDASAQQAVGIAMLYLKKHGWTPPKGHPWEGKEPWT